VDGHESPSLLHEIQKGRLLLGREIGVIGVHGDDVVVAKHFAVKMLEAIGVNDLNTALSHEGKNRTNPLCGLVMAVVAEEEDVQAVRDFLGITGQAVKAQEEDRK
jgi:hypothetical protein